MLTKQKLKLRVCIFFTQKIIVGRLGYYGSRDSSRKSGILMMLQHYLHTCVHCFCSTRFLLQPSCCSKADQSTNISC
ncbi:hypothetical protein Hanom_Chr09g00861831 [Helianthus anomalus]